MSIVWNDFYGGFLCGAMFGGCLVVLLAWWHLGNLRSLSHGKAPDKEGEAG